MEIILIFFKMELRKELHHAGSTVIKTQVRTQTPNYFCIQLLVNPCLDDWLEQYTPITRIQ